MRYKNIKTGAIVDSSSIIKGKDWEVVEPKEEFFQNQKGESISGDEEVPMSEKEVKEAETQDEYVEEEVNLEEMTKKELIEFAKEQDIEVNEKGTKPVIIEAIVKVLG